jgi:hypothetical protein
LADSNAPSEAFEFGTLGSGLPFTDADKALLNRINEEVSAGDVRDVEGPKERWYVKIRCMCILAFGSVYYCTAGGF